MNSKHRLVLMLVWVITGAAYAKPYIPTDENQILERLPEQLFKSSNSLKIKALRNQLKTGPEDWSSASQLAQHYIELAQSQADPRYMGYAQALLKPWWEVPQPSTQALILRAMIRQNAHDFTGAVEDLEQILKVQPAHSQANLIKATIATVQGDYEIALQHCQRLMRRSSMVLALACQSTPASLSGKAETSYRLLHQILLINPSLSKKEKVWAWAALAEIAWRSGKFDAADEHFQTAMQISAKDRYLRRVYADFLLQQHRPTEVINLIGSDTNSDALLLRLAMAEQMTHSEDLTEHLAVLKERFKANRKRGSTLHQGDEARFKLHLVNQPQAALQLARQNWQVQRESSDTYILLQSAIAANDVWTVQDIKHWLAQKGTEDVLITKMLTAWEDKGYEI